MEGAAQILAVATVWVTAACFGAGPKLGVVTFDYAETSGAPLKAAAGLPAGGVPDPASDSWREEALPQAINE